MKTIIQQLIPLAVKHQKADEYISGSYWDGKVEDAPSGCSIADLKKLGVLNGVSFDDHKALAEATGVTEMLWRLSDNIFEGLPNEERPAWTPLFLRAISKAKDLANAPARIMARLADRLADDAIRDDVREVARLIAELWRRRAASNDPPKKEWYAAREQADAAREQADAAWKQADAAREQADAARRQADAARRQADAAREQADAAWKQADAAWEQADAARRQADAAWRQADAAWEQWWSWCADIVCEELKKG